MSGHPEHPELSETEAVERRSARDASVAGAPGSDPTTVVRAARAGRLTPEAAVFLQRTTGNRSVASLAVARSDQASFRGRLAPRQRTTEDQAQRQVSRQTQAAAPGATTTTPVPPWQGTIATRWNAALRRTPHKDPADPYGNIVADLPRGTPVTIIGSEHGWLRAEVDLGGRHLTGFVSHELVQPVIVLPEQVITAMTIGDALVALKRHETEKANTFGWKPTEDVQDEIDSAIGVLESTKRYTVDRGTLQVSFAAPATGKIKVTTIEDFILFVETVERTYPQASPQEIASEIRQVWFSDENWEVLVASEGIPGVDIETEPDPIATRFDMKDLDPKGSTKKIMTPMGEVDIAHVMSGIDAVLSGAPAAVADIGDRQLKHKTLLTADKSDPRDFATWSGDIGQAYAEYVVDRYVNDNKSATLDTFMADKSPPDQLLGDIHGYIADEVWREVPATADPAGGTFKVSNILRTFYLVDKSAGGAGTYESYFEKVSGKSAADMRDFVFERSLAFARVWYPPKMRAARNLVFGRYGLTKEGILESAMKEFDDKHAENEKSAAAKDKLGAAVDSFMAKLKDAVK
jgi:hypothetical protein